jgi:hypothetical protein
MASGIFTVNTPSCAFRIRVKKSSMEMTVNFFMASWTLSAATATGTTARLALFRTDIPGAFPVFLLRFLKASGSATGTRCGILPAAAKYGINGFHFIRICIFKSLLATHTIKLGHIYFLNISD